jgi:hypothetical protein
VRVVYKGYLAPFTHRCSLIKITERVIAPVNGKYYAILHQRLYIKIKAPRRDFPLFGQPNAGRDFPFQRVDELTLETPNLDPPASQSLFWPFVGGNPFFFRFRFWDMESNTSEASLPVLFGDAGVSQTVTGTAQAPTNAMVTLYDQAGVHDDNDTLTCAPFNNQSIAFAATDNPGDTRYDVDRMCWQISLQQLGSNPADTALQVYEHNLPVFYPTMARAKVSSASIKRITGNTQLGWVKFYSDYIKSGFDPKSNRGEVILQVDEDKLPELRFGAAGKTDQAGGLNSPDTKVVGFSRKSGAVGGTVPPSSGGASLSTWSQGTFNPADFFGGFTSAKLLGAVKLSDIIAGLLGGLDSNLGKAPRMVEQELFSLEEGVEKLENDAVDLIRTLQSDVSNVNPLPKHLSGQAQAVYAAQSGRDSQSKDDHLALILAHATLIRAILNYGSALNSLLQDPAALLAETAMSLLQDLIGNTAFTNFLARIMPSDNWFASSTPRTNTKRTIKSTRLSKRRRREMSTFIP